MTVLMHIKREGLGWWAESQDQITTNTIQGEINIGSMPGMRKKQLHDRNCAGLWILSWQEGRDLRGGGCG